MLHHVSLLGGVSGEHGQLVRVLQRGVLSGGARLVTLSAREAALAVQLVALRVLGLLLARQRLHLDGQKLVVRVCLHKVLVEARVGAAVLQAVLLGAGVLRVLLVLLGRAHLLVVGGVLVLRVQLPLVKGCETD